MEPGPGPGPGPGPEPPEKGLSRGTRAAVCRRAGAAAAASPPGCGRTGLFLAAPPRTEVTRRSARRGRAGERRGEGGRKRERLSQRRHRIPQRVPGREAEPEKPVWSWPVGRGMCGAPGDPDWPRCGRAGEGRSPLSSPLLEPGSPLRTGISLPRRNTGASGAV